MWSKPEVFQFGPKAPSRAPPRETRREENAHTCKELSKRFGAVLAVPSPLFPRFQTQVQADIFPVVSCQFQFPVPVPSSSSSSSSQFRLQGKHKQLNRENCEGSELGAGDPSEVFERAAPSAADPED